MDQRASLTSFFLALTVLLMSPVVAIAQEASPVASPVPSPAATPVPQATPAA